MDKLWNKELAGIMMDKYKSHSISEIVNSPLFIAEFEDWVEAMEKELENSELVF